MRRRGTENGRICTPLSAEKYHIRLKMVKYTGQISKRKLVSLSKFSTLQCQMRSDSLAKTFMETLSGLLMALYSVKILTFIMNFRIQNLILRAM